MYIQPGLKLSLNIKLWCMQEKNAKYWTCSYFLWTLQYFTADHTCNQPGCESVLVLDGNMKNARQVCSCRDVGELKFAGMDGSVVGK